MVSADLQTGEIMGANDRPLYAVQQTTVDGSGNATLQFRPSGEEWVVTAISVNVSTQTLEAQARVYRGQIGDAYYVDGSISGSTGDTSDTQHELKDGEPLYVVWTGADIGAIVSATIRGRASQFSPGGFRAVS